MCREVPSAQCDRDREQQGRRAEREISRCPVSMESERSASKAAWASAGQLIEPPKGH